MILTTKMLVSKLNKYSNPNTKIKRMVDKNELFTICKGLYEDNKNTSPKYLANAIYGPSYISFNFALSYYGLIPETVYEITSATTLKGKRKEYSNYFGNFTYRDRQTNIVEQIVYNFIGELIFGLSNGQVDADKSQFLRLFLTKNLKWNYQKEWRLIGDANAKMSAPKVKTIYLGKNVTSENEIQIINWCEKYSVDFVKCNI